jgi:hypothetical protein
VRCLAAKHAELKEGAMSEDAAAAASKRQRCKRYDGFWRRCFIGDSWKLRPSFPVYTRAGIMRPPARAVYI